MPTARSTKYRSLQVGSGKNKIKFKDGVAEVTAAQAKRLEKVSGVTVEKAATKGGDTEASSAGQS